MNNYEATRFSAELVSRLRGEIARFDVSQAQLALLCGVSQSQFSKIVRGVRPITVDQFAVICDALQIDMGKMAEDVERFIGEEDTSSTPVVYVSEERKLAEPWRVPFEQLDAWGKNTAFEWDTSPEIVGGSTDTADLRQSDHDLAAKKRSRDRGENYGD